MYMYLLLFTTCLNVETEVQCTAVPSTLTLWMETKWSNPLLIRNLRWHADVTGIYKGKNIQIISKCNSPTFTIRTEYLYFYTLINSKFQQVSPPRGMIKSKFQQVSPPPPPRNPQHSTESVCLSIRTHTWFRMPDTYILDLKHHWSRIQFAEF